MSLMVDSLEKNKPSKHFARTVIQKGSPLAERVWSSHKFSLVFEAFISLQSLYGIDSDLSHLVLGN